MYMYIYVGIILIIIVLYIIYLSSSKDTFEEDILTITIKTYSIDRNFRDGILSKKIRLNGKDYPEGDEGIRFNPNTKLGSPEIKVKAKKGDILLMETYDTKGNIIQSIDYTIKGTESVLWLLDGYVYPSNELITNFGIRFTYDFPDDRTVKLSYSVDEGDTFLPSDIYTNRYEPYSTRIVTLSTGPIAWKGMIWRATIEDAKYIGSDMLGTVELGRAKLTDKEMCVFVLSPDSVGFSST